MMITAAPPKDTNCFRLLVWDLSINVTDKKETNKTNNNGYSGNIHATK